MDIEVRLRALESHYRQALSAAASAKAEYLALLDEGGTTPAAIQRARQRWIHWDERKRSIAARMGEIEDSEQHVTI